MDCERLVVDLHKLLHYGKENVMIDTLGLSNGVIKALFCLTLIIGSDQLKSHILIDYGSEFMGSKKIKYDS